MNINKLTQKAKGGCADSQYALGLCLVVGYGVDSDNVKAGEWLIKAAKSGHKKAPAMLGRFWDDNFEPAYLKQFSKYMCLSGQDAEHALGWCFYNGMGVEQSYDRARIIWEELHPDCSIKSTMSLEQRKANDARLKLPAKLERKYTEPSEISGDWGDEETERDQLLRNEMHFEIKNFWHKRVDRSGVDIGVKALKNKAKSDDAGNAQFALGLCYACGFGVTKDSERAWHWIYKAADKEHSAAMDFLGYETLEYLCSEDRYGEDCGGCSVNYYLGLCFFYGNGVERDYAKAYELWNEILVNVYDRRDGEFVYRGESSEYKTSMDGADAAFNRLPVSGIDREQEAFDEEMIYNIKRYLVSIEDYLSRAKSGDAEAMYDAWRLGCESERAFCYFGISMDCPVEFHDDLLFKSAKGGYAKAQYQLGMHYRSSWPDGHSNFCYECISRQTEYCICYSFGVYAPDPFEWNEVDSLGNGYQRVSDDANKAIYWFTRAARQKYIPAIAILDIHYKDLVNININLDRSKARLCA